MPEPPDDLLKLLKQRREEVARYLARLDATIETYQASNGEFKSAAGAQGVTPAIVDIAEYLRQQGKPMPQLDIIRTVGEKRRERYPALSNHYSSVWRALEYHYRHDRVISCVNQHGRKVKLKPLSRRPKGKHLANTPELYQQDNWFTLKEHMEEGSAETQRHLGLGLSS